MTPLKYRFWHQELKRMYNVTGIGFERELVIVGTGEASRSFRFDQGVLMQWTGLIDKNGVDVYQHDLVRKQSGNPEVIEFTQAEGPDGGIIMGFAMPSASIEDLEVVGDIYTTPHLLESK